MSNIDTYFSDFLTKIRLTPKQREDSASGHTTLRDRLMGYEDLKGIIVTTFLQGSYKRSTAVRPLGEKRADVDIIVVTNLNRDRVTPQQALDKFVPFADKYYKGKWKLQGRSIGIELSYVDLDIVVTSAPSEVEEELLKSDSVRTNLTLEDFTNKYEWRLNKSWTEPDLTKAFMQLSEAARKEAEWKSEPLWIPDRDAGKWETTDPLEQIRWTREKNKKTNGHYINVVKALKWWRLEKLSDLKYPKGYPIEHMIGDCCPDDITSVADGVTKTLDAIVSNYFTHYHTNRVPILPDRGVPDHNVWKRISLEDFKKFYEYATSYAKKARAAHDETSLKKKTELWQEIFGSKFPVATDDDDDDNGKGRNNDPSPIGGYTPRTRLSEPKEERFA